MAIQQKKYEHRKKQYIFNAGDEFVQRHRDLEEVGKLVTIASSAYDESYSELA
jgi:hypothetical protein